MGSLNVDLEGYAAHVAEFMIRRGFVKTKSEALRLALYEFGQRHHVVPDEDTSFALLAEKILRDVDSGREETSPFDPKELD